MLNFAWLDHYQITTQLHRLMKIWKTTLCYTTENRPGTPGTGQRALNRPAKDVR